MSLPDWSVQLAYGRVGWALILAAVVLAIAARVAGPRRVLPPLAVAAVVLAAIAWCLAPGRASPAYWLAMGAQWPSALLVALAGDACWRLVRPLAAARPPPLLPIGWASAIAAAGALLYADIVGWLAIGLYPLGFGPVAAPLLALLAAAGCVLALSRGVARERALVLLVALLAWSIGRLPTGNLWDAMFDPLLWLWSLASVCAAGWARWRQPAHRGARPEADPVIEGPRTA
ncbi:MAG: hypothetical protein QM766_03190 [Burkholderiaceae bacterium]